MTRRLLVALGSFCLTLFAVAATAAAQTGSITGTVTNVATGLGIQGVSVIACDVDNCSWSAGTASNGAYTIASVPAGTYRVYTYTGYTNFDFFTAGVAYIDQVYKSSAPTIECGGCQVSLSGGSTITVAGGATAGINFALRTGPRITGVVKDAANNPIPNVNIYIYRTSGGFWTASYLQTQGDGTFKSGGMPPGFGFAVLTNNSAGFIDRIYNNTTCVGGACNTSSGSLITFAPPPTANVTANFTLDKGGVITGKVSDSGTGVGLTFGWVNFYNASGQVVAYAFPITSGVGQGTYTSPGLPAGTYYAAAYAAPSYITQVYNGIECSSCNVTTGNAVNVVTNQTTPNINFSMVGAGAISGALTDATSALAISSGSIQLYTTGGAFVTSATTAGNGTYTVPGLPTGDYIVKASGPSTGSIYIPKVYSTGPGGSYDCQNCNVTLGTAIHVAQPSTTGNINLALNRGGTINGNAKRASDNTNISGLTVSVLTSTGSIVATATTDGSGNYSIGGLFAGTYYVRTFVTSTLNFVPETYAGFGNHVVCISCPATSGTPLTVTLGGTQTANFLLTGGGTISGTVSRTQTGTPWAGSSVLLYNNLNTQVTSTFSNGAGVYTFTGLPAGTYYVRSNAGNGLIDEVYNNIPCVGCSPAGGTPITLGALGNVTGIDLALSTGGRITGRVVDQDGIPMASGSAGYVVVYIYTAGGAFATSGSTDINGTFLTSAGLPGGTYYAVTGNGLGYINTLYDDISCFSCYVLTGTPISVTAGNTTTLHDLVLRPGGRITGKVRTPNGSGGFNNVSNVFVEVYSNTGIFAGSTLTNSLGNYTLVGLPADLYFVKTSAASAGLIDQLYSAATCVGCDVTAGTPVSVLVGSTTPGIDFVLTAGGAISGKVTDAGNASGVVNVTVQVYSSIGGLVGSTSTLGDGTYLLKGLATGSYFVRTTNTAGYINLLKASPADIICGSCTVTAGSPIAVASGSTTPNVNFALSQGGILKGRVTDGSIGLSGISITVLNPSAGSVSVGSASTDANGNFSVTGLIPGDFLLKTANSLGFIDEVWDNLECVNCTVTNGSLVPHISANTTVTLPHDIQLTAGGRIRGTVTDATGSPLTDITVDFYRASGSFVSSASTNGSGGYVSGSGLPVGDYLVRTRNSQGYVDRIFNGITCVGCSITSVAGTVVTLANTSGLSLDSRPGESLISTASNVNFALPLGGSISGTITSAGKPIEGVFVQVYTSSGSFVSSTSTNGLGQYIYKGLPTGTYFVRTSNSLGYIDQLFSGVSCISCTVTLGIPVSVTVGNVTPGINFSLTAGGRVTGTVTAAGSGAPIQGVSVQIYTSTGAFAASGFTSPSGAYVTNGLPAGIYYARTFNSVGYVNLLHGSPSDIVCASCTVTAGAPFTVTAGNSTPINFVLTVGGSISGKVSDASGGLFGVSVLVYTTTNAFVNSALTNASGDYAVTGLPTGSYSVRTSNSSGYVDELYNDIPCLGCYASMGTPISVTAGATTTSINFNLAAGGRVSGTITDAATGAPIPNVSVNFYNASGFFIAGGTTDNLGKYLTRQGMPTGTYYARTSNLIGYINVTYPSNTCLNCAITVGTPIAVTAGQITPSKDFALTLGGRITGTVTDVNSAPLAGVGVFFMIADGTIAGSTATNSLGAYSSPGLPAGTYFARTSNGSGYVNQVFNSVNCVRCTAAVGTPISVGVGAPTPGVNFALVAGGRIGGVVRDSGTGLPIAGISVNIIDAAGFTMAGAVTDANGQYQTLAGLTTGTYYARTFNAVGYVNRLYDTFNCLACNPVTGKPIAVTLGQTTASVNFDLSPGGRIAGTVTANGLGLPDAFVDVFSSGGTFLTSARTGTSGQYITGEGLPSGKYYLITENAAGFIDELYDNNPCGFACAVTSGAAVEVTSPATAVDKNFALAAGGRISGRVTDSNTGLGLASVTVGIFNAAGVLVANGFTDGLGSYTSDGGLPTGTYYVMTFASSNTTQYVNKLYNNIICTGCDPLSGTKVTVTAPAMTPNVNFSLGAGEVIGGRVTDAATGRAIVGAGVRVFNATGVLFGGATTDEAGNWTMTSAVNGGTYFARTINGVGYVDRLYDTDICLACDVTRGTPIVVDGSGSTGGINFGLTAGGRISGVVSGKKADGSSVPVAGSKIRVFNSAGSFIGQVYTNGVGQYTTFGLPPGNYFVRTANTSGYIDQLYVSAPCIPCSITDGTPITVVNAGIKSGINFLLDGGGLVAGYVKDQATGAPIKGVTVAVYLLGTTTKIATTDPTDANGYYQISLPIGQYEFDVNPIAGFRPVLGNGLNGPFTRQTVNVDTGTETTGVGFLMAACSPITISPATLPLGAQGQLYGVQLSATGGQTDYTFSLSDGYANTGLALNSSGLLAGTFVFPGTGNFTVAVSDANQCGGSRTYALTACSFILSTSSLSATAAAGNGSVTLSASASDCPWVVTTTDTWIKVTSAVNGVGGANVTFTFSANASVAPRTGTLRIAGKLFTITQAGSTVSPPFGVVDTPAMNATGISGSLAITGWALDDVEVKRVTISRNAVGTEVGEIYLGDATLVDGARTDIANSDAYKALPFHTRAGWGYLLLTNMLPNQGNGSYTLHVDAIDAEGNTTRLGDRTFTGDNAHAVKPFGAIDTPAQGGTVSGTVFVNFGWALTPTGKSIPTNGSTITVFIDGAPAGHPTYNNFRSDVAGLFPGLANTGGAIGFLMFDTTTWTNGVHTIAWVVSDSAGAAEGIGSRYFTVNNVLASQTLSPSLQAPRVNALTSSTRGAPAVSVRTGFDGGDVFLELQPDTLGGRSTFVSQLGRVELRFGQACGAVTAVQKVDGGTLPLPIGSTLDPAGLFSWMPGPAFLGTYDLEFTVPNCAGGVSRVPVTIMVTPGK